MLRLDFESRLSVLRRMAAKFVVLCVAMAVVIGVGELLMFRFVAYNGWLLNGPGNTFSGFEFHWQARFGYLPSRDDRLMAPVGRPERPLYYGREYGPPVSWYRTEKAGPPNHVVTENGLITYAVQRGPSLPFLPSPDVERVAGLDAFSAFLFEIKRRVQDDWHPMYRGEAIISSDGRLWCEVISSAPFFIRAREYVGTVDEFMPPSSARGWKTTHFSWAGLTYNVILFLILFGWMFFVRDVWTLIGYKRYRAKMRRRRGLCVECGYDLQGRNDRRCPECGNSMPDGVVRDLARSHGGHRDVCS